MTKRSYWLYALGEVSLIVVGILIALQVDNWREDVSNNKKVKSYYESIVNDLSDQLVEIESQIKSEIEILRESERLIDSYNKNRGFVADEAYTSAIGNINNWRTFIRIDPAFEQLLATGDVGLIKQEALKKKIFSYFHQLRKVETIITENHEYVKSTFAPLVLKVSDHSLPNFQNDLYQQIVKLGYVPEDVASKLSDNGESLEFIREQLKKDDVRLELYNSIKYRYRISAVHLSYLEELKGKTEQLRDEIKGQK
jgi:hypothetical protein